jgi:translation initiation factor IF-1
MKVRIPALVSFLVVAAGPAAAQQPTPTPVEEHVVAPSLPDQPNKEGVVHPSGSLPTDAAGYVTSKMGGEVNPASTSPAPGGAAPQGGVAGSGAAGTASTPAPPAPAHGKAKVKAAYLSVRGTVRAYDKGVSITVVEADGKERTARIAAKASVYQGLAVGDRVVVRIPLGKPADGQTTDHVERQRPPQPPPKSKFTQAQSPAS